VPKGLFAPEPQAGPAHSSFHWVNQRRNGTRDRSRSRETSANGRARELSNGDGRTQALGAVRKMLEEMRVSPAPSPSPTKSDFGRPLSPAPPMSLCASAPANVDRGRSGAWTPSGTYVPPGGRSQPPGSPNFVNQDSTDRADSNLPRLIPTVSINDENPDAGQQSEQVEDDDKGNNDKSMWQRIHEAVEAVEKLEGPNWPSWSFWFHRKVNATSKDLWGHLDGSCPRPDPNLVSPAELESWDKDEAAIYCVLFGSLDFKIIHTQVRACTTAKGVWDHLELLYREKPTPESCAVNLIRELSQVVYFEGEDLQQYLHRIVEITDELKCGPYVMPLELAKGFMLDSLPGGLLKHVASLRTKCHLTIQEVCQDILEIGKQVLGDECVGTSEKRPCGATQRQISASLPYDLRHYKYTGDGLSDGGLFVRARHTCTACLAIGHKAFTPNCPQTEARLGLWGFQKNMLKVNIERSQSRRDNHGHYRKFNGPGEVQEQGQHLGMGNVSGRATPGIVVNGPTDLGGRADQPVSERSGRVSDHNTPWSMARTPSNGRETGDKVGIVSSKPSAFELQSWR
jgi:hypothetical protein